MEKSCCFVVVDDDVVVHPPPSCLRGNRAEGESGTTALLVVARQGAI